MEKNFFTVDFFIEEDEKTYSLHSKNDYYKIK